MEEEEGKTAPGSFSVSFFCPARTQPGEGASLLWPPGHATLSQASPPSLPQKD